MIEIWIIVLTVLNFRGVLTVLPGKSTVPLIKMYKSFVGRLAMYAKLRKEKVYDDFMKSR